MLEIWRIGSLISEVICYQISMAANGFLFNLNILQIDFLQKATLALYISKLKPIKFMAVNIFCQLVIL